MCLVRPTRFKKKKPQKNSDGLPMFKNQEISHKNPDFRLHFKNLKIRQDRVHTPLEQLARAEPHCPFGGVRAHARRSRTGTASTVPAGT